MNNESSVPGVSLEAMVKMSLRWDATSDPAAEHAEFDLPRNAGRLRLLVHESEQGCELSLDYQDPGAGHPLRNVLRERYRDRQAAKKWAVLRVMTLIWIVERSHGNTADFHFEAPAGL